ncbi:MAG: hypothetical protein VX600_02285 [Candidatus Neomarinimicrobiota bacterium]|nr:hypothetical protein [Candidatus Neomarinimicrobiota bacterium]
MKISTANIHPERGFLPYPDPLLELPRAYRAWDDLGRTMPELLQNGDFRKALKNLGQLDPAGIQDGPEVDRSMLLLSMFANAYVNWGAEPVDRIPKNLAVPLWEIARRSGRPPISSHASIVLTNWRRIDPDGPIIPENLTTLQNFLGGKDEDWFYLATVGVESAGGTAINTLFSCINAVRQDKPDIVVNTLRSLASIIQDMIFALEQMYEYCSPDIFYHKIRPFLTGWSDGGIIYEGVSNDPKMFIGGSAAQSSLLQALDAGLGIAHPSHHSGPFLIEMRKYMPPGHRSVLSFLESDPVLQNYLKIKKNTELSETYNECVSRLNTFRKNHLEMAIHYIADQEKKGEKGKGTGGTQFVTFLSTARIETHYNRTKK